MRTTVVALSLALIRTMCHPVSTSAFIAPSPVVGSSSHTICASWNKHKRRSRSLSTPSSLKLSTFVAISNAASSTLNELTKQIAAFKAPAPSTFTPYLPLILPLILLRNPIGLSRPLFIASIRTLLQLSILGGLVLSYLFQQSNPAVVLPYLSALAIIAAGEACSRSKYTYPKVKRHALTSLILGCGSALLLANPPFMAGSAGLGGGSAFNVNKLIPLWGLVLGNSVTAVALLASNLLTSIAESQSDIDLYLARGATVREATTPTIKAALTSALTPIINSLSVCGLVHIPGVMAGQILAGMDPSAAGKSQAAVMLLLAGASSLSAIVMSALIMRRAFSWNCQRVCDGWGESLVSFADGKGKARSQSATSKDSVRSPIRNIFNRTLLADNEDKETTTTTTTIMDHREATSLSDAAADETEPIVLHASSLPIERSNCTVSFKLRKGQRLGITGSSGSGKTSLLRVLSLLEGDIDSPSIKLYDKGPAQYAPTRWRRMVTWVSQHRPSLPGSPSEFHNVIKSFHSGQKSSHAEDPTAIASTWGLDASLLDRSWSALSGGEAARAALASAVALGSDVLLLDEPTAGCDARTEKIIEDTLKDMGCTIIIVTHSREQLDRFCTHHICFD
mmetsp:Transcript_26973/g.58948  ORF Transcript_26973/g.58948 Transcript_26973/m.58948 type:complete len:622 (+) Transcript_26973:67-1932(+)